MKTNNAFSNHAGRFTTAWVTKLLPLLLVLTLLLILPVLGAQAAVVLTTLYSFTGTNDGGYPDAALVQGSDGYFYGTTSQGGTNNMGTVFKISTAGALTTLYSFGSITNASGVGLDGGYPYAALVQGSDGNFYGTTSQGGTNGTGTVFKISANGAYTTLHSFNLGDLPGPPPMPLWCRAATAISMARLPKAARMALAPCSKSAPMER